MNELQYIVATFLSFDFVPKVIKNTADWCILGLLETYLQSEPVMSATAVSVRVPGSLTQCCQFGPFAIVSFPHACFLFYSFSLLSCALCLVLLPLCH